MSQLTLLLTDPPPFPFSADYNAICPGHWEEKSKREKRKKSICTRWKEEKVEEKEESKEEGRSKGRERRKKMEKREKREGSEEERKEDQIKEERGGNGRL